VKGLTVTLPWRPSIDQIEERIRVKWSDLVFEVADEEAWFFENRAASMKWYGASKGTKSVIHLRMTPDVPKGSCEFTFGDPRSPLVRYISDWPRPIQVGDRFEVVDLDYPDSTPLRTVTVTEVTSKSFTTDDNMTWSLRGCTPWHGSIGWKPVKAVYRP